MRTTWVEKKDKVENSNDIHSQFTQFVKKVVKIEPGLTINYGGKKVRYEVR